MLGMKWRIWQEKILLLMRIKKHDVNTLCRQIYEEGRKHDWPGLGQEVAEICNVLGIPDVNVEEISKSEVKEAIFENHYKEMMEIIKSKSKLDAINGEDFRKVQDYFHDKSVENSRMAFRIRTEMVKEIPGNFKNKYRVRGTLNEGLICLECQEQAVMTQSHCITCPAWTEIRSGLDLSKISDMVVFFRKLLVERAKV